MENTVGYREGKSCVKKGLDTKYGAKRQPTHRMLRLFPEGKNREKKEKNTRETYCVDIKLKCEKRRKALKTAWDKEFSTFSTDFSTYLVSG